MTNRSNKGQLSSKQAINNLIKYSQSHNHLLYKFNLDFFIDYFDCYSIEQLEQKMGTKHYKQSQFVRQLACFILHSPDQTLFLVMSLMDLFDKIISQSPTAKTLVTVKDFTTYLCEGISIKTTENIAQVKEIPAERSRPDPNIVRDIDLHPAIIETRCQKQSTKISRNLKKKQKKISSGKPLHIFEINTQKKDIITLGRLATHLTIFNFQLQKKRDIIPANLHSLNASILSMAFSQKQQRIGCILKHLGLAFWDYQDNFSTEKQISKAEGDKIYYLQLLDQWATTSRGSIIFWDLKLQKPKYTLSQPQATVIHHIQEVTHIRCLAVSYTLPDGYRWLYIYRNQAKKLGGKKKIAQIGAQKICYHKKTQTVLLLGTKTLPLYLIDPLSLDPSLIAELEGHETIITSFTSLEDGLVITGDDRGSLRIWDLNTLRCQQTFKVANLVTSLHCLDRYLFFSDSRLNLLHLQQLASQIPVHQQFGLNHFYRIQASIAHVFVFTKVSCRIYNLMNGRAQKVVELCQAQQEIIAVEQLADDFLISTSKAYLFCYTNNFKLKWKLKSHTFIEEEILHIKPDQSNHFFTTIGKEGNLNVWNERTIMQEGPRKSILNQQKGFVYEVVLFDLSEKYSLMVTADKSRNVKIWSYQSCKLSFSIDFEMLPSALKLATEHPLLAIGCPNDRIYLYEITCRDGCIEAIPINYAQIRNPEMSLNSIFSVGQSTHHIAPVKKPSEKATNPLQELLFYFNNSTALLTACYNKGNIITYSITQLKNKYFNKQNSFKTAVNIQRPVKETLEKQLSKNHYKKVQELEDTKLQKIQVFWNKKIHNDSITSIKICHQKYFSTLSLDGYLKFTSLEAGQVVASLCLQHPLPILWKLQISQEQQLAIKIHNALTLLDDLSKLKFISKEELDQLNVLSFMKMICTQKINYSSNRKKQNSILLLKNQLSRDDLHGINAYEESLKSMETFRRVSLIKASDQYSKKYKFPQPQRSMSTLKRKQIMMKILSPSNRNSVRLDSQQEVRLHQLITKNSTSSAQYSLQKSNDPHTSNFDTIRDRKIKQKLPFRSLSHSIRFLQKDNIPLINHQKEDLNNKKMIIELKKQEPLTTLPSFFKNLQNKLPKQHTIKKHLKKHSNIIPKF